MSKLIYKQEVIGGTSGGGGTSFTEVTQAEYDALPQSRKDSGEVFVITDAEEADYYAQNVSYKNTNVESALDSISSDKQDKTDSNLATTAKTVSGAINELNTNLAKTSADLNNLVKITQYTGTTDQYGRVQKFTDADKFIYAYAISPNYACINVAPYGSKPGLFYFREASTGNALAANTAVTYAIVTLNLPN